MIALPPSADFLKMVGDWIGSLLSSRAQHEQHKIREAKDALVALMKAATTTRAYLAELRHNPEHKSHARESDISQQWIDAGAAIAPVNSDLANAFFLKADYWADPEGWVAAGKDETIINLDRVSDLGRQALLAQVNTN